ncbi:hypothetical protein H257_11934 [Aphanomyces astaci]|uniref:Uncharacterized protein n=1 Tax=Aphanomyces astaci TaxID=112090 RepID=W4G0A6_APHAT|nr:hypothetical protein H257_11934 [Aphanomyces astaci]ETV73110.1 hypothetical protein H257_11934 [Aphanomyces astaci]|eukprot:XP_009837315.1 hypothetical protein H257_11934 [Aphanomyces astaci]
MHTRLASSSQARAGAPRAQGGNGGPSTFGAALPKSRKTRQPVDGKPSTAGRIPRTPPPPPAYCCRTCARGLALETHPWPLQARRRWRKVRSADEHERSTGWLQPTACCT